MLVLLVYFQVNYQTGNTPDTHIMVPLHIAVSRNMSDVTSALLAAGVKTEYVNKYGDTALMAAIKVHES